VDNVMSASVESHRDVVVTSLVAIAIAAQFTSARGASRARPPPNAR
jgi:hypothetical protein